MSFRRPETVKILPGKAASSHRLDAVLRAGVAVGAPEKRKLRELDPKQMERDAIAAEMKHRAPPPPPPSAHVVGTIVYVKDYHAFAVEGDDDKLWWYPNIAINTEYTGYSTDSLVPTKLFILPKFHEGTLTSSSDMIEVTSQSNLRNGADNVVVHSEPPGVHFKFPTGTKVSFVPYKRSELKFNDNDELLMHEESSRASRDYTQAIPKYFEGVATQVRMPGSSTGSWMLPNDDEDPPPVYRLGCP